MYCPECRSEYRPGFVRCADCGVELVDHLPAIAPVESEEGPEPEYSDYVTVSDALSSFELQQICAFLQANGIPAEVRADTLQKIYGGHQGTEVLVPREFETDARDLLERADSGEWDLEDED